MSLVPAGSSSLTGGAVAAAAFTPSFRDVRRVINTGRRIYRSFRQQAAQARELQDQRNRHRREVGRSARRRLFDLKRERYLPTKPSTAVMKRTRFRSRRRSRKVGLRGQMSGKRIITMKYCHRCTLEWNATAGQWLNSRGLFKANSVFLPGQFALSADATYDASGTDLTQIVYNNYRVLSSTCKIVSVRAVSDANNTDPIMCGINICESGAAEGNAPGNALRGSDLGTVTVNRDRYREAKGLMGAGRTNIFNSSTATRGMMKATFIDRKFFKGDKINPIENRTGLLRSASENPYTTAISNISPADPATMVYFQPWACHPYATGALAVSTSIECLVEITYRVLALDKYNGKAAVGDT